MNDQRINPLSLSSSHLPQKKRTTQPQCEKNLAFLPVNYAPLFVVLMFCIFCTFVIILCQCLSLYVVFLILLASILYFFLRSNIAFLYSLYIYVTVVTSCCLFLSYFSYLLRFLLLCCNVQHNLFFVKVFLFFYLNISHFHLVLMMILNLDEVIGLEVKFLKGDNNMP